MRRSIVSLLATIVAPFMSYLSPQPEDSLSPDRRGFRAEKPEFNSEMLCLLIFIAALAFIAVISPALCLTSLFIDLKLEGLWYFWLITFAETGYSLWLIGRKKRALNIAARKPCQITLLGLYYDCPINRTHYNAYSE